MPTQIEYHWKCGCVTDNNQRVGKNDGIKCAKHGGKFDYANKICEYCGEWIRGLGNKQLKTKYHAKCSKIVRRKKQKKLRNRYYENHKKPKRKPTKKHPLHRKCTAEVLDEHGMWIGVCGRPVAAGNYFLCEKHYKPRKDRCSVDGEERCGNPLNRSGFNQTPVSQRQLSY